MIPRINLEKRTINGQNVRFLSYTETGCDAWLLYVDEDGVVWLAGSDIGRPRRAPGTAESARSLVHGLMMDKDEMAWLCVAWEMSGMARRASARTLAVATS